MEGKIDKWVCQLLLAQGVVEDKFLQLQLQSLFSINDIPPTNQLFTMINNNLRVLSFEIKSIVSQNNAGEKILLHGLVNTEEDFVAKLHGCAYDSIDTKIFTIISTVLLQKRAMTTHEIVDAVRVAPTLDPTLADISEKLHNESRVLDSLKLFFDEKWLRRNDKNLWELAPRSFLELSSVFQDTLTSIAAEGDQDLAAIESGPRLPQLIIY